MIKITHLFGWVVLCGSLMVGCQTQEDSESTEPSHLPNPKSPKVEVPLPKSPQTSQIPRGLSPGNQCFSIRSATLTANLWLNVEESGSATGEAGYIVHNEATHYFAHYHQTLEGPFLKNRWQVQVTTTQGNKTEVTHEILYWEGDTWRLHHDQFQADVCGNDPTQWAKKVEEILTPLNPFDQERVLWTAPSQQSQVLITLPPGAEVWQVGVELAETRNTPNKWIQAGYEDFLGWLEK